MNIRTLSVLLSISCVTSLHTMDDMQTEQPINNVSHNAGSTLYSLCKNKILAGYGNNDTERYKNALQSIEKISAYMDNDFVADELKKPFLQRYFAYLPCATTPLAGGEASYLTKNNHKLYATIGKNIYLYDLTVQCPMVEPQKIISLHESEIDRALASKKSAMVYSISKRSSVIKLWDTDSDECKGELVHAFRGSLRGLSEMNDGNPCATDIDGNITIWDISSGKVKQSLPKYYDNVIIYDLLADTHMIYAAGGMDGLLCNGPICIYDTRVGKCIEGMNPHGRSVIHLAKSKKDMHFYSSSFDNTIRIWDMRNMKDSVHKLEKNESVWRIEENDDGTLFFTCGDTGVHVWDLTTEKPSMINTLTTEKTKCMAQDTDESQLFIGTNDGIKSISVNCAFDDACIRLNRRFKETNTCVTNTSVITQQEVQEACEDNDRCIIS